MPSLWQDFRFALRTLARSPVFTAVAVLSLALGIGANTAIFSLLDQLLLRMLPVRDPAEFVQLAGRGSHYGSNWGMDAMSYPMYRDFRDKASVFSGVVCRRSFIGSLGHNGQVERARVELVSGNYFQVLGVGAALGRTLLPEDDARAAAHPVVVLAYDYWRSRFGGDPAVLNRAVILNDAPFTVLGVAAEGFFGMQVGDAAQVFVPMMMQERIVPNIKLLEERRTRFVNVFARLRPGVTLEQARAAVAPLYKQIIEMEVQEAAFARASREAKDRFLQSTMAVFPGATGISPLRRQFSAPVYVLMTLVGFVLSIACANVANLQLARATARQREIAVRLAVGASRGQIVRQLLVESVTLALAAGAAGLLLARWSVGLLLGAFPPEISRLTITADLDRRLLLFNFAVSVLVGIVFGVAPALQATRPDLASTLKEEGGGLAGGTHARLRKTLVVAQVGLSLLLLVGAGLFVHSLYNTAKVKGAADLKRFPLMASRICNAERIGAEAEKPMMFLHEHQPEKIISGFPLKAVVLGRPRDQRLHAGAHPGVLPPALGGDPFRAGRPHGELRQHARRQRRRVGLEHHRRGARPHEGKQRVGLHEPRPAGLFRDDGGRARGRPRLQLE